MIMNRKLRLLLVVLMAVAALGFAYDKRLDRFEQQEAVFDPWR